MGDVLEEMADQVAERLFGVDIFLPAMGTEAVGYFGSAVQAVFIFSKVLCFHERDCDFGCDKDIDLYEHTF